MPPHPPSPHPPHPLNSGAPQADLRRHGARGPQLDGGPLLRDAGGAQEQGCGVVLWRCGGVGARVEGGGVIVGGGVPSSVRAAAALDDAMMRLPRGRFCGCDCAAAGHGRALLEAIEDMCRALGLPRILLCSTGGSTSWAGGPSVGGRGATLRAVVLSHPFPLTFACCPRHACPPSRAPGPPLTAPPLQTTRAPRRPGSAWAFRSRRPRTCGAGA